MSGDGFLGSGVGFRVSGIGCRVLADRLRVSSLWYRAPNCVGCVSGVW